MEGLGSRLARASSRYGTITFKGPVRKWKKGWVPYQPPVAGKGRIRPKNHNNLPENEKPDILLCRWTRVSDQPEPATERKLRYTPVVVLEDENRKKKKEAAGKGNGKAKGKEVKEFKPMTREDMLMESDDGTDSEEELEDQEYYGR